VEKGKRNPSGVARKIRNKKIGEELVKIRKIVLSTEGKVLMPK
jgi:hypothetical protein